MPLKVLVTGGAGFIGSHVVDRLVKDGYNVRILDNLSTGRLDNIKTHLKSGSIEFVNGDIRDTSLVDEGLKGINVVIHLAAQISVTLSIEDPDLTFDVNLLGTLNLLRSSIKEKIDRFVFVSSCAVCGDPKFLPVDEKAQTNPISPYAESKLAAERYCLGFNDRQILPSVILRLFNVYGPRQVLNDYSGVITRFIDNSKQRLPLTIHGDGSQTRDFVNVHDIVQAVLASMKSCEAVGQVFHIGTGKPTSVNKLAKTVSELAGVDLQIRYAEPRAGEIKDSFADISKAKKLLGYNPEVSLREGLTALFEEETGNA